MTKLTVLVAVLASATLFSNVYGDEELDKHLDELGKELTKKFMGLKEDLPSKVEKDTKGIVNHFMYSLRLIVFLFDDCMIDLQGDYQTMAVAKNSLQSKIDEIVNKLKPSLDSKNHERLFGIIKDCLEPIAASVVEVFNSMKTGRGTVKQCSKNIFDKITDSIEMTKKNVEELLKSKKSRKSAKNAKKNQKKAT